MGLRGEYFAEVNSGFGILGVYDLKGHAGIFETTLTESYAIGNLTIKLEYRIDASPNSDLFIDAKSIPSRSLTSFVLAAVYSF